MEVIRNHIAKNWELKHDVVGLLDPKHVLIKLADSEDFAFAWTRDNHQTEGALFECLSELGILNWGLNHLWPLFDWVFHYSY